MTNIYFFFDNSDNAPDPYSKVERQNRYIRNSMYTSNHLTYVGSSTHTHGTSGWNCAGTQVTSAYLWDNANDGMAEHAHGEPSWSIASANNSPPYYGLDIIYCDLNEWLLHQRQFPEDAVFPSTTSLTEDETLERFTSADGKYIFNGIPGSTGGSSDLHSHYISGNVQSIDPIVRSYGTSGAYPGHANHYHSVSATSSSTYQEPATVTTRFYKASANTLKAQAGSVVFVDGSFPTDYFTLLTSWDNMHLKAGNMNPTFSGSDSHQHSASGTSGTPSSTTNNCSYSPDGGSPWTTYVNTFSHTHNWSVTLSSGSNVPLSVYLIPVVLTVEIRKRSPSTSVVII